MSKLLLAIERDSNDKIINIFHGGCPWYGIVKQSIETASQEVAKFDNAWITSSGDVWALRGSIQAYTTIRPTGVSRRYVILAKSSNYNGDIFFITDGIENPKWMTSEDVVKNLMNDKVDLANFRIDFSTAERPILPLAGADDFEVVDYKSVQLEYREYLKKLKE